MEDRPYSPATLADRWGCSKDMVYDLINGGKLRYFRVGKRLIRISAEEVIRWEEEQSTNSASSKDDTSSHGRMRERVGDAAIDSVRASRQPKQLQN
jgi:excisionase family DNA binding protein